MKKLFLLSMVCIAAMALNAQNVFVENFVNAPTNGNLEGYNGWFVSVKGADALGVSPKINEGALFYNGYSGTNVGKVAVLDSVIGATSANQRISTHWVIFANGDTLRPIEGQKIYAAFMVNFSTHSFRSQRDFFTFEGSRTSSSTRGRIFAKLNTAGTDITFAISKNSSTAGTYVESTPLVNGVGINHLLVFTYEGVAGATNDFNTLYIDPDLSLSEAQQTNKIVATDIAANTDYTVTVPFGINLRQRGTGAQIGGIRVGTSWNSVLLGTGAIYSGISQVERNSSSITSNEKTIVTTESGSLKIYNLAGKIVLSSKTEGKLTTTLSKGLYLVRFVGNDGNVKSAKVEMN